MAGSARRARARTEVDPARQAAFDALVQVEVDAAYLNLALAALLGERGVGGRDAAFATELAHGTTRLRGRYDLVLAACVDAGLGDVQPAVLVALRMGAHQLLAMRVPAHAAVATSVELTRAAVGERPVRMVNAVLRRVGARSLEAWLTELAPGREGDPTGHLAAWTSHPRWVVDAFRAALARDGVHDEERLRDVLEADNRAAEVVLAARPGLCDVAELVGDGCARGRWSPHAAVLGGGDPSGIAAVREGRAGVQDEGSQLAALALARAAVDGVDRRWLDLCAGPGGKAALLAGLGRERGARVLAAERQPHRARLVVGSVRGYGGMVPVVVADGRRPAWRESAFDRALVDVPCSGLGALRRRPDARWRHQPGDIAGLVELQTALARAAVASTRVGGVVAYVTCSPQVDETRGVVDRVVASGGVREEDARALFDGVPALGPGPHAQLWPDVHGTDAMFVSLLRVTGRR